MDVLKLKVFTSVFVKIKIVLSNSVPYYCTTICITLYRMKNPSDYWITLSTYTAQSLNFFTTRRIWIFHQFKEHGTMVMYSALVWILIGHILKIFVIMYGTFQKCKNKRGAVHANFPSYQTQMRPVRLTEVRPVLLILKSICI